MAFVVQSKREFLATSPPRTTPENLGPGSHSPPLIQTVKGSYSPPFSSKVPRAMSISTTSITPGPGAYELLNTSHTHTPSQPFQGTSSFLAPQRKPIDTIQLLSNNTPGPGAYSLTHSAPLSANNPPTPVSNHDSVTKPPQGFVWKRVKTAPSIPTYDTGYTLTDSGDVLVRKKNVPSAPPGPATYSSTEFPHFAKSVVKGADFSKSRRATEELLGLKDRTPGPADYNTTLPVQLQRSNSPKLARVFPLHPIKPSPPSPGPGDYNLTPPQHHKITRSISPTVLIKHTLNQTPTIPTFPMSTLPPHLQNKSKSIPGPGDYNPVKETMKTKGVKSVFVSKSSRFESPPSLPGPGAYEVVPVKRTISPPPRIGFGSKLNRFALRTDDNPGPGRYSLVGLSGLRSSDTAESKPMTSPSSMQNSLITTQNIFPNPITPNVNTTTTHHHTITRPTPIRDREKQKLKNRSQSVPAKKNFDGYDQIPQFTANNIGPGSYNIPSEFGALDEDAEGKRSPTKRKGITFSTSPKVSSMDIETEAPGPGSYAPPVVNNNELRVSHNQSPFGSDSDRFERSYIPKIESPGPSFYEAESDDGLVKKSFNLLFNPK